MKGDDLLENQVIAKLIHNMFNSISNTIYNFSLDSLDGAEDLINFNMTTFNNIILISSLTLFIALIAFKAIKHTANKDFNFYTDVISIQILRDNIKVIVPIFILIIFLYYSQDALMRFTFNFWNDTLSEKQFIEFFMVDNVAINSSIAFTAFKFLSSITSLVLAFNQIIEIISLKIILSIAPLFLLTILSKKKDILKTYFIGLIKMCLEPIIQTVNMLLFIRILSSMETSVIFKFLMFSTCIQISKTISKMIFPNAKISIDVNLNKNTTIKNNINID